MKEKEKLYETLGELLYVVALADGIIQPSEFDRLNEIMQYHPWGNQIKWSFDYEARKGNDFEAVYNKVISYCHSYGPAPEYDEFIELVTLVAQASEGVDDHETKVISDFSKDLIQRFKSDLEHGLNRYK